MRFVKHRWCHIAVSGLHWPYMSIQNVHEKKHDFYPRTRKPVLTQEKHVFNRHNTILMAIFEAVDHSRRTSQQQQKAKMCSKTGVVAQDKTLCCLVSQLKFLSTVAHLLLLGGPLGMVHRFKNSHQDGVVAVDKRVCLV